MKLTVNTNHLALIDRVAEAGMLGKSRGDVLKGAVIEHVRFLLGGGTPFLTPPPGVIEVDTPIYGAVREEVIVDPITGKAIPVRTGEVLRISQVEGGTCVDYNAYNLHDYKEWLDCGFNRTRGVTVGKGTIIWTGSPRARPMQAILDHSDNFDQYYQGHRCNGLLNEIEYGFIDHPNCQDTFAEAIREYGLTPDDVHDSYNLWMRTTVTPDGRREFHWNRARKNDYVDLLAVIDTLSVPIICGIDTIPLNNYGPGSIRLQVFAASPSTLDLVEIIQVRLGRFRAQKTPKDFKNKDIRAQRELERDPNYAPNYLPIPTETSIDVNLTEEVDQMLQSLLATGDYLESKEHAVLHSFLRWYDVAWPRDHVSTKLKFRPSKASE
jgi:uncharacterized protein